MCQSKSEKFKIQFCQCVEQLALSKKQTFHGLQAFHRANNAQSNPGSRLVERFFSKGLCLAVMFALLSQEVNGALRCEQFGPSRSRKRGELILSESPLKCEQFALATIQQMAKGNLPGEG